MTKTELREKITSFVTSTGAAIAGCGRLVWKVLTFSMADDRIAPGQCLAVVIERGGISVAYGRRLFSRMKIRGIRRYSFEEGEYPTPESLSSAVRLALSDLKAARAQVVLVIPKAWAIMKTVEWPITVKDRLSDVMSFELDRLTPFSSDRAFYDFRIISEDEDRIQVMLAAAKADVLQPYIDALKGKRIDVNHISVGLSAMGTLSHYLSGKRNTIFADISSHGYEGGLLHTGILKAAFAGSPEPGGEQSKISALIEEINSVIETVKEKMEVPGVFVNNQVSGRWKTVLQEKIIAPIRFMGETDLKMSVVNTGNVREVPYAAVGGVLESLWPNAQSMNLLDKGVHKSQKTPLALTVVLLSVLAALGTFWLIAPLQVEESRMEIIDREIMARKNEVKKVEALTKELEGVEKELNSIESFKSSRPMVLDLVREMSRVMPKNTWLSRLRITDTAVEIEGSSSAATAILSKLEASPYFKKVEFSSPTFRDTRLNTDRFFIKMEIETPEEEAGNGRKG